ncbi:hypothetical protein M432DRAFT_79419 [Thermoascus aurantiacus ATCC 26904]
MSAKQQPTQSQGALPRKPRVLDPQEVKELGSRPRQPPRPVDIRQTPEYRAAARRWTSVMVGLPILIYTSYVLYERAYGGKRPKRLIEPEAPIDNSNDKGNESSSSS